jgi:Undecaprenyl-phosphate glucose phosphotransferase
MLAAEQQEPVKASANEHSSMPHIAPSVAPAGPGAQKAQMNQLAREVAELYAKDSVSSVLLTGTIRAVEWFGIFAVSLAIFMSYVGPTEELRLAYIIASMIGASIAVLVTQAMGGYAVTNLRAFSAQFPKALAGFAIGLMALLMLGFLTKSTGDFSRFWFGAWFGAGSAFLGIFRAAVTIQVRRLSSAGRLERRAVIVGGGKPAEELISSLENQDDVDIRICGIFDDRDDDRSPPFVAGYPKLGTIAELVEFARVAKIGMLIVSLPITAETRVLQLLRKLWVLPVDIRLSAHSNKLRFRPRSYSFEGSVPFLDVLDRPIADWDAINKRVFDLVVASLAILVLSPLMLITAIAIKLDSKGPVLFRQKRYGFNNELIEVFKFRSMHVEGCDPTAAKLVTKDDPRVTRVGRFIRKTSIDELPQLLNVVLKGDLSLVGPRPHALHAKAENRLYDQVVDGYFARHKVKPGITGWAQINGWRGETDTEEKIQRRVEHDLYYIENWSILFDLYILAVTPFRLLNTENAY